MSPSIRRVKFRRDPEAPGILMLEDDAERDQVNVALWKPMTAGSKVGAVSASVGETTLASGASN